jgi:glycosyltransferase involved in cell wall biosynthesis
MSSRDQKMRFKCPAWSVMVPVADRTDYLEECLASVLKQGIGPIEMQVEVVDNSTSDKMSIRIMEIVRCLAGDRIRYYRQPFRVSMSANWNSCIARAEGHWLHILHDDDIVLPGFYEEIEAETRKYPHIGAAFTRYVSMDSNANWTCVSPMLYKESGLIPGWTEALIEFDLVCTPAVVVKREVYNVVGGFTDELFFATDWDMWKRIALRYGFVYVNRPLMCYREHVASGTAHADIDARFIFDVWHSIKLTHQRISGTQLDHLTRRARVRYVNTILDSHRLRRLKPKKRILTQVRRLLSCWPHVYVVVRAALVLCEIASEGLFSRLERFLIVLMRSR